MKLGVPWRVKGIRPDARETAREAARRAGMSVGEWLNTIILDSADEEGVRLSHRGYDDEDDNDQFFAVHERLDELNHQLERLQRAPAPRPAYAPAARGPEAYAPPSYWQNRDHQLAEAIARLERRMDDIAHASRAMPAAAPYAPSAYAPPMPEVRQPAPADAWNSDMDQAMAEINARMLALDADPEAAFEPAQRPAAATRPPQVQATPVPSQNLAGLEQHLRHLTGQIEALRQQPQLQEGLAALREALSDIARTLLDAMPKRALEALEGEIRSLASRLDKNRHAGVDGNALAAMESALAEIRDTLKTLRPAENLNGFREAVHSLAQKIDMLGAAGADVNSVQQIETAVAAMQNIVSQVASNEALAQLAAEVRTLSDKIDGAIASESNGEATQRNALEILDQRVAHIAEALESRVQNGGSVPPQLEAVIQSLTDKIERLQHSGSDGVAVGHLEDRIAHLVEKLDASGARFSQLEAIERGLSDLLVQIENRRGADAAGGAPPVDGLQRDLARTQTSLEAVHGTLGHVVDRLAMLESDLRDARNPAQQAAMPPAPQLEMPARKPEPPALVTEPAPAVSEPPSRAAAHAQAVAAMARANPPVARTPIDPNLPPDHPLEPGFNPRARLSVSPADRIAASEAALGSARQGATEGTTRSNFIAAARRAAKAAAGEPTTADLRAAAAIRAPEEKPGKSLAQRVRNFFVGASVLVLAAGALRIAANVIDFEDKPGAPEISNAAAPAQPESTLPALDIQHPADPPPSEQPAKPATPDVTGSVKTPAQAQQSYTLPLSMTLPLPSISPSVSADKLPPGIGGPILRQAAAAGDAAAEYEIGLRYVEGRGVTANPSEAARWLEAAAKQGLVMAQFRLAGLYEKGIGVKKDVETARRLYKTAAEQGNAKAMHNLAVLYAEGAAVKPDYKTAAQWFRSGAEYGLADSQYNLAILYARGIGVDQNLVESYKWFALAANQGDQEAGKKRDEVAKRLDPQALATAKLAVQVFVPKQQPEAATTVKLPPGGWDAASSGSSEQPPAKPKRNTPVRIGSR